LQCLCADLYVADCAKCTAAATAEDAHHCRRTCHSGACGPCEGVTEVECRCGGHTTELPCRELAAMKSGDAGYTCDSRCNKKMSCGRHKCGRYCCVGAEHQCRLVCGCELLCLFMVALCNRADHYIFALGFLSFFFLLYFFA